MDKILEILKNNDWDNLEAIVETNGANIKTDFKKEDEFIQYVQDRIEKYEVTLDGYDSVSNNTNGSSTLVFNFKFGKGKKLSTAYIKSLGDDIMIDLTPEEIQDIQNTEGSVREKFLKVVSIKTDDVEPLYYPFEEAHTYLREDDDTHVADHQAVLDNAPTTQGDFVTVVKVVK